MKRVLSIFGMLALVVLLKGEAKAYTSIFDQGHSTATHKGIIVTTGTVIQIDSDRASALDGYRHAGVRVVNDNSFSIYCGYNQNVTISGDTKGEAVSGGSSSVFQVWSNVPVYCIAAPAAGAGGVEISVAYFGFGAGN